MNCNIVQNEGVVERYVLGHLSEAEQASFEEHFFACEPCFEEVRLMQSLQAVAASRPRKVVAMPSRNWIAWGAVAALLIAGVGLVGMLRVRQQTGQTAAARPPAPPQTAEAPSAALQLLARAEAPRYIPSNLRSAAGNRDRQFRAAMASYTLGEYAAAAAGLRDLANGGPETAAARFYLGVSDLLTGNVEEAVTQLRGAEALGETPYLEPARFFLAKALLAKQDVAGATRALEQTVALSGDREAEARRLLEQLRALPTSR